MGVGGRTGGPDLSDVLVVGDDYNSFAGPCVTPSASPPSELRSISEEKDVWRINAFKIGNEVRPVGSLQ